jgi:hypothetical protein
MKMSNDDVTGKIDLERQLLNTRAELKALGCPICHRSSVNPYDGFESFGLCEKHFREWQKKYPQLKARQYAKRKIMGDLRWRPSKRVNILFAILLAIGLVALGWVSGWPALTAIVPGP